MKHFAPVHFDKSRCKEELAEFRKLLESKPELDERSHLQPFFKNNLQLSAFIGTYVPDLGPAKQLAFEFPLCGDFTTDLIVGCRDKGRFIVIEFEDGVNDAVFRIVGKKATPEWTPRFEHGFSQIVD